jgi:hypothetical protein
MTVFEQPDDGGIIDEFAPADPLMAIAWADCLRWAVTRSDIVEAFRRETGIVLVPVRSPLDRMIDAASGRDDEVGRRFLAWFNANVWGEEKS